MCAVCGSADEKACARVAPRRMCAAAHARGAQRAHELGVPDSRPQVRGHGLEGQEGARVAPRRRRLRAHGQNAVGRLLGGRGGKQL
eukprot:1556150-Pleurochrysis_carterae.AAC.1